MAESATLSDTRPTVLHVHFWADIRNVAGSVEKVILAFANQGQRYRHLVACCPSNTAVTEASFFFEGIEVHTFKESKLLNRVANKWLRLNAFTYGSLVSLINYLEPDILHFHNRQELIDPVLRRLAYRPRVAVHYHRHFQVPDIPVSADCLVYPSQATQHYIEQISGTKKEGIVILNPLSLELLRRAEAYLLCEQETTRKINFLYAGGDSPIKGWQELLAAFSQLKNNNIELKLAGFGTENLPVADQRVQKLGQLNAENFFNAMQGCDIVVMPSHFEPFGLIAQEAMLCRKLLVTTRTGGLAEFVPLDAAVIAKPKDAISLHQALEQALDLIASPNDLKQILDRAEQAALALHPHEQTALLELRAYG